MTLQENTPFPGLRAPAVGFEAPLQMLAACHLRVEHQLATLQRLAAHLPRHGADLQAQHAAQAVLRYFDSAARHHHDDEELDLFPALIESMAGSDAVCLREMAAGLAQEHRVLEALWRNLRGNLQQIAAGTSSSLDAAVVAALVDRYCEHMAREDAELLPMAMRLLDDAALDRIGRAMHRRRGIAEID